MKTTSLLESLGQERAAMNADTVLPETMTMTLEILEALEKTSTRLVRTLRQAALSGTGSDAGAIEYDSWHARSAGELEYESWH